MQMADIAADVADSRGLDLDTFPLNARSVYFRTSIASISFLICFLFYLRRRPTYWSTGRVVTFDKGAFCLSVMRKNKRQPVSRPARVELDNGSVIQCRIADVSPRGAMLLLPDSEWLPTTFYLLDTFANLRKEARVVWTSPNRVGIQFIGGNAIPDKKQRGFGKRVS